MNATVEVADKLLTDRHPGHEARYTAPNRNRRREVRCACGETWQQGGTLADVLTTHAFHVAAWSGSFEVRSGEVGYGWAWSGWVRRGKAWYGRRNGTPYDALLGP